MLYCLFFQDWKAKDSLMYVPNFLFSYVYLSFLFNFKIGYSLGLSCLVPPMFIIILIIRIIKAKCFNNTFLMVDLKEKLPQSRWSLSVHNFLNSGYFHKIFGMHFKKGLVYLYTKKILPPLLHFWIYYPSPNGKITSFIGDQVHL